MRNFVGTGDQVTLTAPAGGVLTGVGYVIGAMFVVAVDSEPVGRPFAGRRTGIVSLPKPAGVINEGARLWWNNTTKQVATATATGLFPLGTAAAAAVTGATSVEVALDGIATVAAP
jgi:predicted RecA/RadA family phage recombinase